MISYTFGVYLHPNTGTNKILNYSKTDPMSVQEYSSMNMAQAKIIQSVERYSPKYIEKTLLLLIAFLGIAGSVYVFSMSTGNNNSPNYNNLSIVAASAAEFDYSPESKKEKFKDFISIDGKKKAGEMMLFTFKGDRKAQRYVMDMGNGERVIITSDEFPYSFSKPGKYLVELKTINKGLITVVAEKELKIK